jgi:phosphate transport system substrate-binding protein
MTNTNQNKNSPPPIVFLTIGLGVIFGLWQLKGMLPSSQTTPGISNPSSDSLTLISSVANVPAGTYRYGGSTSWATARKEVDAAIRFSFPKFKLEYVNPASGNPSTSKGIEMLLDGKLDFVQSSKGIPADVQQQAAQKGIKLTEIPISIDAIAVAVHPSLNIPGLTVEQLEAIQSGKITNWKELNGADLPIRIYAGSAEELNGAAFSKTVNSTDAFRKVASDPAGIHFGSSGTLTVAQCGVKTLAMGMSLDAPGERAFRQRLVAPYQQPAITPANCSAQKHNQINPDLIKSGYPLLRKLSVVILADGGVRQQAGEAYANMLRVDQGQNLMKQAGYLTP